MTVEIALISHATTDIEQKYSIRSIRSAGCNKRNYELYKGDALTPGTVILSFTKTTKACSSASSPQLLEFFDNCSPVAKLESLSKAALCSNSIHKLTSPDGKELAEMQSTGALMCNQISVEMNPYFRSINGSTAYCKVISFVLLVVISACISAYAVLVATRTVSLIGIWTYVLCGLAGLVSIGMIIWCINIKRPKKEILLELVGYNDGIKYADVYLVWNSCCKVNEEVEIICYKEMNQLELIGLVSASIRSTGEIYG